MCVIETFLETKFGKKRGMFLDGEIFIYLFIVYPFQPIFDTKLYMQGNQRKD